MLSISAIKDANGPLYFKKKMGNLLLPKTKKKQEKKTHTKSSLPSCYVLECMLLTQYYAI